MTNKELKRYTYILEKSRLQLCELSQSEKDFLNMYEDDFYASNYYTDEINSAMVDRLIIKNILK